MSDAIETLEQMKGLYRKNTLFYNALEKALLKLEKLDKLELMVNQRIDILEREYANFLENMPNREEYRLMNRQELHTWKEVHDALQIKTLQSPSTKLKKKLIEYDNLYVIHT